MHTYIHTYIHTYVHTYVCGWLCVCLCNLTAHTTHTHTYTNTHTQTRTHDTHTHTAHTHKTHTHTHTLHTQTAKGAHWKIQQPTERQAGPSWKENTVLCNFKFEELFLLECETQGKGMGQHQMKLRWPKILKKSCARYERKKIHVLWAHMCTHARNSKIKRQKRSKASVSRE